ncbi:MAG: vWA domain-containing protein [Planctomycetota bacterium]
MNARVLALSLLALPPLASLAAPAGASDAGLSIVVILDNSGSMNERFGGQRRIDAAKASLLTVLSQTPPDARVGVVLLNPPVIGEPWLVPLGPVDPATVAGRVNQIRAGGPTPLGGAMKTAADALLADRAERRFGDYKLLIVSDGEATDAPVVAGVLPQAQARGLLVDVIGVAMASEHSLAQRAATYRNAADPASLEQAISAVVLGESTADDATADAGESDFELLEGVPVEVAAGVLTTLAAGADEPLVTPAVRGPWAPPAQPGPQPRRGVDTGWFGALLVVGFFVMLMINVAKKMSR